MRADWVKLMTYAAILPLPSHPTNNQFDRTEDFAGMRSLLKSRSMARKAQSLYATANYGSKAINPKGSSSSRL